MNECNVSVLVIKAEIENEVMKINFLRFVVTKQGR